MKHVLEGHTDAESAYVIADYPYGFRLRCQMRVWVETDNRRGQRIVRQTSNPKRPGLVWNKPKASTYSPIILLELTDEGHVERFGPDIYNAQALADFGDAYAEHLDNYQRNAITHMLASHRARKHYRFEIHECKESPCLDDVHTKTYKQREKEGAAVISKIVNHELRRESNAALAGEEFERVYVRDNEISA